MPDFKHPGGPYRGDYRQMSPRRGKAIGLIRDIYLGDEVAELDGADARELAKELNDWADGKDAP